MTKNASGTSTEMKQDGISFDAYLSELFSYIKNRASLVAMEGRLTLLSIFIAGFLLLLTVGLMICTWIAACVAFAISLSTFFTLSNLNIAFIVLLINVTALLLVMLGFSQAKKNIGFNHSLGDHS